MVSDYIFTHRLTPGNMAKAREDLEIKDYWENKALGTSKLEDVQDCAISLQDNPP